MANNELLEWFPRHLHQRTRRHLRFSCSSAALLLLSLSFLEQAVHFPRSTAFSPPVDLVVSQRKRRTTSISYPPTLSLSLHDQHDQVEIRSPNFENPCVAPASAYASLKGIFSSNVDNFLVDMATATGSFTFKLQLPIPNKETFIVGDVDAARKILMDETSFKPYFLYGLYRGITGKTCEFSMNDMDERYQEIESNIVRPCTCQKEIDRMNSVMETRANVWIEKTLLPLAERQEPFDPTKLCTRFVFDTYMESLFEYEANEEDFEIFHDIIEKALPYYLMKRVANPFRAIFGPIIPSTRKANYAVTKMKNFAMKVIDNYRLKENKSSANTFIKTITDENGPLKNEKERVAEIINFTIASSVTTGAFLSSILIQLSQNEEVTRTLQRYIALDNMDESNTGERPGSDVFRYLNQIMFETERLNSPGQAFLSIRETGTDLIIDTKSSTRSNERRSALIPKGSLVFVAKSIASKNPDIYSSPLSFIPERWDSPTSAMVEHRNLSMFSTGSRSCPGRQLALYTMGSLIPKILSKVTAVEMKSSGKFLYNGLFFRYSESSLVLKTTSEKDRKNTH